MYRFLCAWLPAPLANILVIVWYAALIALTVALSSVPLAEFRYGNI